MKTTILIVTASLLIVRAGAQNVLFDFDNAPLRASLPISLTVAGVTAQLSATGQGFSIQAANVLGFTPAGFAGNCISPNSISAADLMISFSVPLIDFSILYAPHELACDSSATMRVTAYLDSALVGTATTNAPAGTWPSETLAFSSAQGFNRVVVHYDQPPVTGGDWGPIFMADNMSVTPQPPPPPLQVSCSAQQMQIAWPTNYAGFTLQENVAPGTTNWSGSTNGLTIVGSDYQVTVSTTNGMRFFRLWHP